MTYALLVQDLHDLARFEESQRYLDEALVYANDCEVRFFVESLWAFGHRLQTVRGEWEAAEAGLREIVGVRGDGAKGARRYAVAPLAGLLARRGAEDAPAMLAWADDIARRADCFHDWWWAGQAQIEAAWLTGRPAAADDAIVRLEELTARCGRETARGELERWKRRLGRPHQVPPGCPEVFAAGIRGDWHTASVAWEAEGAPYLQALELLDSGQVEPTLRALRILDALEARPAARVARGRLRELGVSHIPRGPQPTTRAHPAGLSERQLEVLTLLAEGLTNAEIAARLVISGRTTDHHVSAILAKLDVRSRREAAAVARDLGLAPERRVR
jgi:DNA-binding CsgD family transcriptional regulator